MYIEQIYTGCLAQASYYLESNGEAIIVDPIRDTDIYIKLLNKRNAKLKYVFETHFHADFISGHIELTRITDARIVFGPNAETLYDIISAKDQQEFNFGDLKIKVLHTPGHTLESVCYLLLSSDNIEQAVFTGDTLFIGEVGRPDLAVNRDMTAEDLAGCLYDSLHDVLMQLPDSVIVYPGHGAGSACGKNIGSERTSTIGEQKQFNYALQKMSKLEFINLILDGMLQAPEYFSHDVLMNKEGYEPVSDVLKKSLQKLNAQKIKTWINKNVVLLDVRMPNDFEKSFIPGSINIGKTGMFAPWVGNIISPKSNIIIICYPNEECEIISRLARIGYHKVVGYVHGIIEWKLANNELDSVESIHPTKEIVNDNKKQIILDVRKHSELESGFVKDSIHIPLSQIENQYHNIKKSKEYWIYCAGGYRSMIACSILKSKGYNKIKNIYGGFSAIARNVKDT
tara:strand:- start:3038 stop:4402 length:1365 start_codon:yes stop_codon:yes gene_type:complete